MEQFIRVDSPLPAGNGIKNWNTDRSKLGKNQQLDDLALYRQETELRIDRSKMVKNQQLDDAALYKQITE